ncbi:MAG TPA: hypothetical protein VGH56_08360 [Solirubrobacteraceae bacterium]
MTWVAWRQFRTQALVTVGLLAAFAALVLVTGLHLRDTRNVLGGASCGPGTGCPLDGFEKALSDILPLALLAIPALLGMFWGAPLLARELESGTFRLAWTQSVTRRRWLSVRVVLVGVSALAVAGLASWLVSWWLAPVDAANMNRFAPSMFSARGVVAIGYAGLAFALGVAAGALLRRTLPAMVATLLGFVAARIVVTFWVRPHLLDTRQVLVSLTAGKGVGFVSSASGVSIGTGSPPIPNAWMVSAALVDRARNVVSAVHLHDLLVRTCPAIAAGLSQSLSGGGPKGGGPAGGAILACQRRLSHHLQQLVSYQPPSHYWPMQALETGLFLVAACALIGVTIWRVGPRAAPRSASARATQRTEQPLARDVAPQIDVPSVPAAKHPNRRRRRV